jgi:hypothetical protein
MTPPYIHESRTMPPEIHEFRMTPPYIHESRMMPPEIHEFRMTPPQQPTTDNFLPRDISHRLACRLPLDSKMKVAALCPASPGAVRRRKLWLS